jgi:hypothetical protein
MGLLCEAQCRNDARIADWPGLARRYEIVYSLRHNHARNSTLTDTHNTRMACRASVNEQIYSLKIDRVGRWWKSQMRSSPRRTNNFFGRVIRISLTML